MRIAFLALLAGLLCLACGACSHPKHSGKGTQRPYSVKGKTYYPLASAHGYSEEGLASWYGHDFNGRRTASGEIYDMHQLTAAHKILPMNTLLTVTNLGNGREVTVRINDRGPFVSGRVIDLSLSAAKALSMTGRGTAKVRLATVGDIPGVQAGELPGPFYVQVGAFAMFENAEKLYLRILRKGYMDTRMQQGDQTGRMLWRVQAGTFPTLGEAQSGLDALRDEYPDAFVIAQ